MHDKPATKYGRATLPIQERKTQLLGLWLTREDKAFYIDKTADLPPADPKSEEAAQWLHRVEYFFRSELRNYLNRIPAL